MSWLIHFIRDHTWVIIVMSGFITAPITFFCVDSLQHPERYKEH